MIGEEELKIGNSFFITLSRLKNLFISLFFIVLILLVIWISLLQFRPPESLPFYGNKSLFSAERSMEFLKQIASKPRPMGSKEHDRVRDYLVSTLTQLGYSPDIQKVEVTKLETGNQYVGTIENIVVRIPGENPSGTILISSHYDSVENSPGAADAGSGVAAILETARTLSFNPKLKNDLIILITDAEEIGLLGAQAFVKQNPLAKNVDIVFNFEARGSRGPSVMFETNNGNASLISEFVKYIPNTVSHSFISDLYVYMTHDTDLTVFKQAGKYGLNFAFFDGMDTYHTPNDTINNLDISSLQHHGNNMLQLVQHFGSLNLVNKEEGNRIYFNILQNKVITYSDNLVIPFLLILVFLYIFTFIHGYQLKKVSLKGTIAGFFLFIAIIMFAYYVCQGTNFILGEVFIQQSFEMNKLLLFCLVTIYLLLMIILYQLVSKRISKYSLSMGAILSWLILLLISSMFLKASSYIFLWPSMFTLMGLNVLMRVKSDQSFKVSFITFIFSIPGLLIIIPVIYIIYVLFTPMAIDYLLPLIAFTGSVFIPFLCSLKIRRTYKQKVLFRDQ